MNLQTLLRLNPKPSTLNPKDPPHKLHYILFIPDRTYCPPVSALAPFYSCTYS